MQKFSVVSDNGTQYKWCYEWTSQRGSPGPLVHQSVTVYARRSARTFRFSDTDVHYICEGGLTLRSRSARPHRNFRRRYCSVRDCIQDVINCAPSAVIVHIGENVCQSGDHQWNSPSPFRSDPLLSLPCLYYPVCDLAVTFLSNSQWHHRSQSSSPSHITKISVLVSP